MTGVFMGRRKDIDMEKKAMRSWGQRLWSCCLKPGTLEADVAKDSSQEPLRVQWTTDTLISNF